MKIRVENSVVEEEISRSTNNSTSSSTGNLSADCDEIESISSDIGNSTNVARVEELNKFQQETLSSEDKRTRISNRVETN